MTLDLIVTLAAAFLVRRAASPAGRVGLDALARRHRNGGAFAAARRRRAAPSSFSRRRSAWSTASIRASSAFPGVAEIAEGNEPAAAPAGDGRLPRSRRRWSSMRAAKFIAPASCLALADLVHRVGRSGLLIVVSVGGDRVPASGRRARAADRAAQDARSRTGCRMRSTCSSSASKPAAASIRRSSRPATSSRSAYPALAEELRLITTEIRAGKPRLEAFKNFAARTNVDDVQSLVALLVQTDKFGTSIAQALRTHAETSRTKRRQRAEERAAKIGVKLVFPLVLFLFPALYVVILGPAVIQFLRFVDVRSQRRTDMISRLQHAAVQS